MSVKVNYEPFIHILLTYVSDLQVSTYDIDVLWGQPIMLIQVVSTSEFHEY